MQGRSTPRAGHRAFTHSHQREDSASSSSKQDGDVLAAILNMGCRKITDQSGPVSTPNGINSAAERLRIIQGLGNVEFPLLPSSEMTDYTCFGSVLLWPLPLQRSACITCYLSGGSPLWGHQACRRWHLDKERCKPSLNYKMFNNLLSPQSPEISGLTPAWTPAWFFSRYSGLVQQAINVHVRWNSDSKLPLCMHDVIEIWHCVGSWFWFAFLLRTFHARLLWPLVIILPSTMHN